MTDAINPAFTASASASGGRTGHTQAKDGSVKADLSVPKEMGGPGKPNTTTPEHLFAAGYAACYGGAIDYVATQKKVAAKDVTVTTDVSIGPREKGGFGLMVKHHVSSPTVPTAVLKELANEAHEKICPYSHATRGNVQVDLDVQGV